MICSYVSIIFYFIFVLFCLFIVMLVSKFGFILLKFYFVYWLWHWFLCAGKVTPRPPSRATHYSASPDTHTGAYLSYSYTPSPTGIPNGTSTQYHSSNVTLGLHNFPDSCSDPLGVELGEEAYHNLGLDHTPPPPMSLMGPIGLEQHSIPSEPTSLSLDPNSITIDHHHPHHNTMVSVADHMRHHHPDLRGELNPALSTFHPGGRQPPPPPPPDPSHMEGHLVWL